MIKMSHLSLGSTIETPNTFGRNLIKRLGIALSNDGAEATGSSSINNVGPQLHITRRDPMNTFQGWRLY